MGNTELGESITFIVNNKKACWSLVVCAYEVWGRREWACFIYFLFPLLLAEWLE
jgi:hypothetical protein